MSGRDSFYEQAAALPLLTHDQEKALANHVHGNDPVLAKRARNTLVKHNIRLAYKNAAYYAKRNTHVHRDDMIQAGIEGLIRAAEKYDPGNHGTRFSTYATIWVKQKIVRYIEENHSRLCRVPNHITANFINQRMSDDERDEYRRQHLNTISVNAENHNTDGASTVGDTVPDNAPTPPDLFESLHGQSSVHQILGRASLTPQETAVVIYSFGLGGARELTTTEMSDLFDTSNQRITKIRSNALTKIRDTMDRE